MNFKTLCEPLHRRMSQLFSTREKRLFFLFFLILTGGVNQRRNLYYFSTSRSEIETLYVIKPRHLRSAASPPSSGSETNMSRGKDSLSVT